VDVLSKVPLFDGGVRPHRPNQLIFVDDVAVAFDKHDQNRQRLGSEGDWRAAAEQDALVHVQSKGTEGEHGVIGGHRRAKARLEYFYERSFENSFRKF
jgi:hypothetical protein